MLKAQMSREARCQRVEIGSQKAEQQRRLVAKRPGLEDGGGGKTGKGTKRKSERQKALKVE